MPLVNANHLLATAKSQGFALCSFELLDPSLADAILSGASKAESPVILGVNSGMELESVLPAVETSARRSTVPTAIWCHRAGSVDQVVRAINLGCNGVDCESEDAAEIARTCGVAVAGPGETVPIIGHHKNLSHVAAKKIREISAKSDYLALLSDVRDAVENEVRRCLEDAGSQGKSNIVLSECPIWSNVEHCIIYNIADDQKASPVAEALIAEGQRVLTKIPGVREVVAGRAVVSDAQYRYCWIIRFAHPAVIDSYRHHPDHVKFADTHFRPIAGDRISIDFQRIE